MAYYTDEFGMLEMDQDWSCLYGQLESGKYRLIKYITQKDKNKEKYIFVEFDIE